MHVATINSKLTLLLTQTGSFPLESIESIVEGCSVNTLHLKCGSKVKIKESDYLFDNLKALLKPYNICIY